MIDYPIKYYSPTDGANFYQQPPVEAFLDNIAQADISCNSLIQAIELYNVGLFANDTNYQENLPLEKRALHTQTAIKFHPIIGAYLEQVTTNQICEEYDTLPFDYQSDVWAIINHYDKLHIINKELLTRIFSKHPYQIQYVLHYKQIVTVHDHFLTDQLIHNEHTVDLLKEEYLTVHKQHYSKLYFPKSFTTDIINQVLLEYLHSRNANPDIADLISKAKNNGKLRISDDVRLEAIRVLKRHQIQPIDFYISSSIILLYSRTIPNRVETMCNDLRLRYTYNEDYLDACDSIQLVKNFRTLFHFLDPRGRFTTTYHPSEDGLFEQIDHLNPIKDYYLTSTSATIRQDVATQQLKSYTNWLVANKNIYLEQLLEEYHATYLRENYHYPCIPIALPSKDLTYYEKCKCIIPEIENLMRQYLLYTEKHIIEPDELGLRTWDNVFEANSLVDKKYAYACTECHELSIILHQLFSHSSLLVIHQNKIDRKRYKNFYGVMVNNGKLPLSWFKEYQMPSVERLIQHNVLVKQDDALSFSNVYLLRVLQDLYKNEVLPYHSYSVSEQHEIDAMIQKGWLHIDNHLFSRPERAYINYLLNEKVFTNGLQLRNKYMHGIYIADSDDSQHENNYTILLMLFIMLLLKIEDDLYTASLAAKH